MFQFIIRNYISGILFGIIILVLSVLPMSAEGRSSILSFPGADKIIHAAMYAIFSALLTRDYFRAHGIKWRKLLILLASVLAYSMLIELIQEYITSYRSGEILDILANMGGILFGASVIYLWYKIKY